MGENRRGCQALKDQDRGWSRARQRVGSGRGGEAERGGDTERQREPRRHPCHSACTVLGLLAVDLNLLPSLQHLPPPPASPSLTPRTSSHLCFTKPRRALKESPSSSSCLCSTRHPLLAARGRDWTPGVQPTHQGSPRLLASPRHSE